MAGPKWATPERRQHLVELFHRSRGLCVFGHPQCRVAAHYYEHFIESCIADWKAEAISQRAEDWRQESARLHHDPETRGFGRRFDPVARQVYLADQPAFYRRGIIPAALTHRRTAVARVASGLHSLHVDVQDIHVDKDWSKNQRRKARRYGGGFPASVDAKIDGAIMAAVRHFKA